MLPHKVVSAFIVQNSCNCNVVLEASFKQLSQSLIHPSKSRFTLALVYGIYHHCSGAAAAAALARETFVESYS